MEQPYRLLTEDEVTLLTGAFGIPTKPQWELFPTWKDRLRDPIVEASTKLSGAKFSLYWTNKPGGPPLITATAAGNTYAISQELQDGLTKEHLREVEKRFAPWSWSASVPDNKMLPTTVLSSIVAGVLYYWSGSFSDHVGAGLFFSISILMAAVAGLGTILILANLIENNPLTHYKRQAKFGAAFLRLHTAKTPDEIAEENRRLTERMPSRKQVLASMGRSPQEPPDFDRPFRVPG